MDPTKRDVHTYLRSVGYSDDELGDDGDACGLLDLATKAAKFAISRDRQRQGCKRAAEARRREREGR